MLLLKLDRDKDRFKRRKNKFTEMAKLKQGQYDLQDELDKVAAQKEKLAQHLIDNDEKQTNLLKVVEQLTEKVRDTTIAYSGVYNFIQSKCFQSFWLPIDLFPGQS